MIHEKMDVCFLNRYLNQSNALGWHADDSPEMDDERSIAVVSLGAEREIWFRPALKNAVCKICSEQKLHKPDCSESDFTGTLRTNDVIEKLKLSHGSVAVMAPGMQDIWEHRIPKCDRHCGERISLTFRGYVK
jgi:alkylated DNA repair dioxygenase AlkB